MAQDYELHSFKPSDFKDDHGNTWCDAAFVGVSEPVKWVVKDTSRVQIGKIYYGRIEDKTSKAGKPYQRFYTEKKEEPTYQKTEQSDEYWDERNKSIRAQFAIKTAVELLKDPEADDITEDMIERWAKIFYKMVDRIPLNEPEKKTDTVNVEDLPL